MIMVILGSSQSSAKVESHGLLAAVGPPKRRARNAQVPGSIALRGAGCSASRFVLGGTCGMAVSDGRLLAKPDPSTRFLKPVPSRLVAPGSGGLTTRLPAHWQPVAGQPPLPLGTRTLIPGS